MLNFYIKEIKMQGRNKRDAIVSFTEGLNIISGLSNTGKTTIFQCINFMYGSESAPTSDSLGYTTVVMTVTSPTHSYILRRDLDSNQIVVNQTNTTNNEETTEFYNAKNGKNPIGLFWLGLIGINEEHKIIKNESFKPQRLTWRTFSHSLLIDEKLIGTDNSILIPVIPAARTAYLSSLLFLIYGKDFSEYNEQESSEHRKVRKKAVANYINENLSDMYEQYEQVKSNLKNIENVDIELEIQSRIDKLSDVDLKITIAMNDSKVLLGNIIEKEEQLAEANLLLNRYINLNSQYQSDIHRLAFIVDGERLIHEHSNHQMDHTCPFCNGELPESEHETYIQASQAELNKILYQISDLEETKNEVSADIENLQLDIANLRAQKENIDILIKSELNPESEKLKETIKNYRIYSKLEEELTAMENMRKKFRIDLQGIENEETTVLLYKPKDKFEVDFFQEMSDTLTAILTECNYTPLNSSSFNKEIFDLKINGEAKAINHGKGYKSFLNTVVVLAYRKYLADHAKFNPSVFVIDTPLLGLDEGEKTDTSESMQKALFQYFIKHQNEGQLIIIENTKDLPKLNYSESGVNEIIFTRDINNGRYGFLYDI